jgi:hypothetical protein
VVLVNLTLSLLFSLGISNYGNLPTEQVGHQPNVCVNLPWQKNKKCAEKLVYAVSKSPTSIKNEIERLGAIVDATNAFRINANTTLNICVRNASSFEKIMGCKRKAPDFKVLERKEIEAWKSLYFFSKQYPNYVQPQQLSKILVWGEAILKCEPDCEFNYEN